MDLRLIHVISSILLLLFFFIDSTRGQCSPNPTLKVDEGSKVGLGRLNSLTAEFRKKQYTVKSKDEKGKEKEYTLMLCPDNSAVEESSAIFETENGVVRSLGRMNESDVFVSSRYDQMTLVYTKGDKYPNACNSSERRTMIQIRPTFEKEASLHLMDESVGMAEDFCYYLFELFLPQDDNSQKLMNFTYLSDKTRSSNTDVQTSVSTVFVPPTTSVNVTNSHTTQSHPVEHFAGDSKEHSDGSAHHGLSTGSIILILTVVPVLIFFAVGSLYKRFVVGAQGWEQVPFIDFWRKCGSLHADGWRFVTGRRPRGNRYDDYTQVANDEERQPALSQTNNDDHLLPM